MTARRTSIDIFVGLRLREIRRNQGVSQESLAEQINLSFQQIQKYEKGAQRIGAGKLYALAKALGVPVAVFFDGYETWSIEQGHSLASIGPIQVFGDARLALDLIRLFNKIADPDTRERLQRLFKAVADADRAERDNPI